jgi:hypothetical protein
MASSRTFRVAAFTRPFKVCFRAGIQIIESRAYVCRRAVVEEWL